MKTTRTIEMYYGYYDGNAQIWDTDLVEISVDVADEDIAEEAEKAFWVMAENWREDMDIAFCGVFNTEPDEGRGLEFLEDHEVAES